LRSQTGSRKRSDILDENPNPHPKRGHEAVELMCNKTIPVKDETKERLLLYKNSDLRNTMTYDEALNKILDEMGVPAADEIDDYYRDLSAKISG
jgi:hypothetical protein